MTREEAIKRLNWVREQIDEKPIHYTHQALDMAIKALNVPDMNIGDMISRQAAIDALGEEPEVRSDNGQYDQYDLGLNNQWWDDVDAIKALPSAHVWNEFSPDDERLKDHHFYLISHKNYDTPIKAKWHEEGYWTEPFTRETLYWRHDEDAWDNVSAWMYLPKKYKEEREE